MILDRIDQATPEELAQSVFQLLLSGTADRPTYEKMRDRRLLPALLTIIQTNGRPPFAPPTLSAEQTTQVTVSSAHLLGDIARRDDQEVTQALLALLDQDNDRVSLAAAVALGQIGAVEASEKVVAFTRQMMGKGELGAVARLARALARIGDEDAQAYLQSIVAQGQGSDDKQLSYVAVEAEKSINEISHRLA